MAGQPLTRARRRKQMIDEGLITPDSIQTAVIPTEPPKYIPFNQTQADIILHALVNGLSLRRICEAPHMPSTGTVIKWIIENEIFGSHYAQARQAQADTLVDDILYISDHGTDERRDALRIDARKWIASKLKPKTYGDIKHLDVSGGVDLRISPSNKPKPIEHKADPQIKAIDRTKGG